MKINVWHSIEQHTILTQPSSSWFATITAYCNDYTPVDFIITLCYFSHVNNIRLIDWLTTNDQWYAQLKTCTRATHIEHVLSTNLLSPVSEMTYTVSSGMLNFTIPYLICLGKQGASISHRQLQLLNVLASICQICYFCVRWWEGELWENGVRWCWGMVDPECLPSMFSIIFQCDGWTLWWKPNQTSRPPPSGCSQPSGGVKNDLASDIGCPGYLYFSRRTTTAFIHVSSETNTMCRQNYITLQIFKVDHRSQQAKQATI